MSSSQAQPPPGVNPTNFARRAIGRSPEEHAALERVLAERRRRRGVAGRGDGSRARSRSPAAGPSRERADLAQQHRETERRLRELERQQQEHDLGQRRRRQEQRLAAQGRRIAAQAQAQRVTGGLSGVGDGHALLALPVSQRRATLLTPFGSTGVRRRAKGKSEGAGWHKRARISGRCWRHVDQCQDWRGVQQRAGCLGRRHTN